MSIEELQRVYPDHDKFEKYQYLAIKSHIDQLRNGFQKRFLDILTGAFNIQHIESSFPEERFVAFCAIIKVIQDCRNIFRIRNYKLDPLYALKNQQEGEFIDLISQHPYLIDLCRLSFEIKYDYCSKRSLLIKAKTGIEKRTFHVLDRFDYISFPVQGGAIIKQFQLEKFLQEIEPSLSDLQKQGIYYALKKAS